MTEARLRKSSFPPVVDERTRVLVLGSLPGEESLRQGRYYAHPRNQFWRLIGAVLNQALPEPYEARLQALQAAGVGLWDVIASAERSGSLDAAIRDHAPNALPELVRELPKLEAVAFNGGKSYALGRDVLAGVEGIALVQLPSSSPAHAIGFEAKLERWLELRRWLRPG